jgi:hypothetical protein
VAASIRVLRLRVLVLLLWFVASLFVLSNYTWGHYPPPTCEKPGQLQLKYLRCPDDDLRSTTGSGLWESAEDGMTPSVPRSIVNEVG